MKSSPSIIILLFLLFGLSTSSFAQAQPSDLFDRQDVLELRLSGELSHLFKDRGDNPQYHPLSISYKNKAGEEISIGMKAKTRGNFRRKKSNCRYPPLWLNFSSENTPPNSLFSGQDKIKLVTPCVQDKYVLREYLVYKLYRLLTPVSFRARLVRISLEDQIKGKLTGPFFGILLEAEEQMAARNQAVIAKIDGLRPNKTQREQFLTMAVFEYLIGNTDWSVQFRHNVKLLESNGSHTPITVPYDFDHAGIVNAPYAMPAEALGLRSIRERRFRGFCLEELRELDPILARFNDLKSDIYQLFKSCQWLDPKYLKSTQKYLDAFFKTINDPKLLKHEFSYPCLPDGTGRVVIRGLNKN